MSAIAGHAFAQQLEDDRVGQRLEGGIDDIGRDADGEPAIALAIAAFDQNPGGGSRSAIEDTHLVVDKFEIIDIALVLAEVLAQRHVERVDRAIALARIDEGLAVDLHLDHGLGDHLACRAPRR